MKTANLIALLHTDLVGVQVKFKDHDGRPMGNKAYTYLSTDSTIEVGQEVIIDAPSTGMTVVAVVGIDNAVVLDEKINYKWVVSKVDATAHFERMDTLKATIGQIESMRRKQRQQAIVEDIAASLGDVEAEAFDKLVKDLND